MGPFYHGMPNGLQLCHRFWQENNYKLVERELLRLVHKITMWSTHYFNAHVSSTLHMTSITIQKMCWVTKKPFYNFPLVFFSHSTHSNKYHILDKINSDQTDIVEGVYSLIPNKPNTCFSWWTSPGKITKILTYK